MLTLVRASRRPPYCGAVGTHVVEQTFVSAPSRVEVWVCVYVSVCLYTCACVYVCVCVHDPVWLGRRAGVETRAHTPPHALANGSANGSANGLRAGLGGKAGRPQKKEGGIPQHNPRVILITFAIPPLPPFLGFITFIMFFVQNLRRNAPQEKTSEKSVF